MGAGREAAMAGGYGEHWNTAEQILDGDLEAAAVAGAGAAGETLGLPGLGGSLNNVMEGDYTEALGATFLGAAGGLLGGPIGATLGEFAGGFIGEGLGDLGVDDAFEWAGGAAGDAATWTGGAAEDAADWVGGAAEDAGEVAVEVLEDLWPF